MRIVTAWLIAGMVLCGSGCGGAPGVSGSWKGSVTERGKTTQLGLQLREEGGKLDGEFMILGDTGGQDVQKGSSFRIVEAARSGDNVTFTVPLTGKVDDDSLCFELKLTRGRLEGEGYEKRPGSRRLPVSFVRD